MTMIDEHLLSEALHNAAESFEVSPDARSRILAEVHATTPRSTVGGGFMHSRRSRSLVAVAAAIIVALAIALPLRNQESPSVHAASLGPRRVIVHGQAAAAAEEILWRGLVTQLLAESFGSRRAWIWATALYALSMTPSAFSLRAGAGPNPVLFLAALGGGLLWGGMARLFGRLAPGILAHALFDWATVMMFPLWAIVWRR